MANAHVAYLGALQLLLDDAEIEFIAATRQYLDTPGFNRAVVREQAAFLRALHDRRVALANEVIGLKKPGATPDQEQAIERILASEQGIAEVFDRMIEVMTK